MEAMECGAFLGYCGIRPQIVDGATETEIGWHVDKSRWNQGLATEAAGACVDLAFHRFDLSRLVALIDGANVASVRVAEKIGMRSEKESVVEDYPWIVYSVQLPKADP